MNEMEEEIALNELALSSKLQAYGPEDIDEFNVDKKVYLKKFEEVDEAQDELVDKINWFLIEFPETERRDFYKDMYRKAISEVREFKKPIKDKVMQVRRSMIPGNTAN